MRILFVCTGNTCRSALAEALARAVLEVGSGVEVSSAGLYALDEAPATPHAVMVAAEAGADLGAHRARSLTRDLVAQADLVYVMTGSQAEALARWSTDPGRPVALLDPDGRDIADPYGGALAAYRQARDRISAAIARRRGEWTAAASGPGPRR